MADEVVAQQTPEQIKEQIDVLLAEAKQLNERCRSAEGCTADEQARLDLILETEIPAKEAEFAAAKLAQAEVKLADLEAGHRDRVAKHDAEPTRALPKIVTSKTRDRAARQWGRSMVQWLKGRNSPDVTAADRYRAMEAGVAFDRAVNIIPVDWRRLNYRYRSSHTMDTLTATDGLEWTSEKYSGELIKYITYQSPLMNFVKVTQVPDFSIYNLRTKDDTSFKSVVTSGAGSPGGTGTEKTPTFNTATITTGKIPVKPLAYATPKFETSWEERRTSDFDVLAEMAETGANCHARALDEALATGAGNGQTGPQGIEAFASAFTPVATDLPDILEEAYDSVAPQYRAELVWVSNSTTKGKARQQLKDDMNRSLFGKLAQDSLEFDTYADKPWIMNENLDDDLIYLFNASFFNVVMVQGENVLRSDEVNWPHSVYASAIGFTSVWAGPSGTALEISIGEE